MVVEPLVLVQAYSLPECLAGTCTVSLSVLPGHACSECEKLEVAEEQAKNNNMLEGLDADPALRLALTSDHVQERGIIIMNSQSIVQMVNQVGGWGERGGGGASSSS